MVTLKETIICTFSSTGTKILWLLKISLIITYITFPEKGNAQMFSVQPEQNITAIPMNSFSVGVSFLDFAYRGPSQIMGSPADFSFTEPLMHLSLDLEGFSAFGLYGRNLGQYNTTYSHFGASVSNNIVVLPSSTLNILIPVRISTDYLVVRNNSLFNAGDEMKQNSFGFHGGLEIRARLGRQVRYMVGSTAGYSFSTSGFGVSGGNALDWNFQNRFFFDRLFNNVGLTVGFDIKSRRYNLDDRQFNYRAMQQAVVVGVTF